MMFGEHKQIFASKNVYDEMYLFLNQKSQFLLKVKNSESVLHNSFCINFNSNACSVSFKKLT